MVEIIKDQSYEHYFPLIDGYIDQHTLASFPEMRTIQKSKSAMIAKDKDQFIGGIAYTITGVSAYVDGLFVGDDYRGQGIATRLIKALEDELREQKIVTLALSTLSYQALPFYQQLNYEVYGQLEDVPFIGVTKYHLMKKLI